MTAHGEHSGANRRGFTLLELLLATSVLASMSVLMGTMLVHARSWRESGDRLHERLALPRVIDLLERQWSERRVLVDGGEGYALESERLWFTCSLPVLDPEWPLVRVIYQIEPSAKVVPGGVPAWRLMYEERRITDVASDDSSAPRDERLVLLDSCQELRFEWYGRPRADEDDQVERWRPVVENDSTSVVALRLIGNHEGEPFSCLLGIKASRSSSF